MSDERWHDEAAAYALGTLSAERREAFERTLIDATAEERSALEAFCAAAGSIGAATPSALPSVRLRRRLLSQVGDEQGFYFMSASEGEWEAPDPRVRYKRLFVNPADARETRWIELAAGGTMPSALAPEACGLLVLDGAILADGIELHAGDWHRRPGGVPGSPLSATLASRIVVFEATPARRLTPSPARTVRAEAGRWRDLGGGSEGRVLELDPLTRGSVMEVRMQAAGSLPAHRHGGAEQVLMLAGDCCSMEREFGPSDYHRARAGTLHPGASTRQGCRMLNLIEGELLPA